MRKTKEDIWVEMSIREIWTQCHFALIAFDNINKKSANPTDQVFSSIHSFLSHATNVSKLLKSVGESKKTIGDVLQVHSGSVVHVRKFRNHLEHYDERLKQWIQKFPSDVRIGTYNIGPKSIFESSNMMLVSHYDPDTKTFTFVDEDFNLEILADEVKKLKQRADFWVNNLDNAFI